MNAPLNLRRIGGSDVAAILGVSSYSTAYDVWLRVCEGFEAPGHETPSMRAGKKMERAIGAWWAEDRGLEVKWFEESLEHPARPWQRFSPDLRVLSRRGEIADVKRARRALDRHGAPGTDELADYELVQLQTYLEALYSIGEDAELGHLVVHDLQSDEVLTWQTRRDADFGMMIVEACERFWRNYVVTQTPPPISGSSTARAWLESRKPKDTTPPRDATPAEVRLAVEWRDVDAAMKPLGDRASVIKNALCESIGLARGLRGPFGSISYAAIAAHEETDWEGVARALAKEALDVVDPGLAGPEHVERLLKVRAAKFQKTTRKAYRRLAPFFAKGDR